MDLLNVTKFIVVCDELSCCLKELSLLKDFYIYF